MAADLIRFDSLSLKVNVRLASISCTDCCSGPHKKLHPNPRCWHQPYCMLTEFPPELPVKLWRNFTCPGVCFSLLSPTIHNFCQYPTGMRWSAASWQRQGRAPETNQDLCFWTRVCYFVPFNTLCSQILKKKLYRGKLIKNSLNPTGLSPCSSRGLQTLKADSLALWVATICPSI